MPVNPVRLRGVVKSIVPALNTAGKVVHIDWYYESEIEDEDGEAIRSHLLLDQVMVPARATDEEILEAIDRRRVDIAPTLVYDVPNPEENQGLVGREV